MNTLTYKGYIGSIEISEADNCLYGHVLQLPKNVEITFEGATIAELKADFEGAVDDYLAYCQAHHIEPKRAYKGSFNVRLSAEIHAKLDVLARQKGMTLNRFVTEKLSECVQ